MLAENLSVSWVDLLVLVLLVVGVLHGRKRGMSEECLAIIKWTLIVIGCALLYEPGGRLLAQTSIISKLVSYIMAYAVVAMLITLVFVKIKEKVGEKLTSGDTFGSAEYYLGMAAGAYRYLCIILVAMAFLNARYYSPADIAESNKFHDDNFGTKFFPSVPDIQRQVFDTSLSGRVAHQYLNVIFIRPTAAGNAADTQIPRHRAAAVDQILDKK